MTASLWLRSPGTALLFLLLRFQMLLPRPFRRLGKKRGCRRFSVVTAVYNAERWLPAYFTSLLCQTLDTQSRLEILCVDDGSSDGSVSVIQQWQRRYPDLIRLIRKKNGGPASARNLGIEAASGEWITFIDADDFVHPRYFAAVEAFLDAPASRPLGMVVCNYLMYKPATGAYKDSHPLRRKFQNGERRFPGDGAGSFVQVVCNSAFFLRRIFLETGIRQKEDVRPTFEDGEMVMRYVSAIASPGYSMDIGVLPQARYYHRRTAQTSSLTQRAYKDPAHFDAPLALGCLRLLRELHEDLGSVPLFTQMTVLHTLSRYMRRILEDSAFAGMDEAVRQRFFSLMREVLSYISVSAIQSATQVDAPLFFAPLLAGAYKGCELNPRKVFAERFSQGDATVRVFYYSSSPVDHVPFFHNSLELKPVRAKTAKLREWDGYTLYEHSVWLPLPSVTGVLHAAEGAADFFLALHGTALGEKVPLQKLALPQHTFMRGAARRLSAASRLARDALVKHDPLFTGCDACPHTLSPLAKRTAAPLGPDFPVDAVYAWVDGSDPVLAAKKAAYLPAENKREAVSHGSALHRDNEELRYSLRSLEVYAPWVNRIFIVTDNQVPSWLNTVNAKIRIVDHTEFIPNEYLPTFSSRPIEAFLHRIPGLGEHYVYLNDDFFLAAPCGKNDFFTANGLPRQFTDWRPSRRHGYENPKSPHTWAYANALRYLEERGIFPDPAVVIGHAPYAQTLSLAKDAYAFYAEAVLRFARNKFRSRNDLAFASQAVPLFACATKRAVPCDVPHYYINTKRFDRQAHYDALLRQKGMPCQVPFFCLNDVGNPRFAGPWQRDMAAFLQAYYPEPSSFELPDCR